jgi:hypothetical protein
MLSNKGEHPDCMSARGESFSTEVLFMILIYEQQKMINELITKLAEKKMRIKFNRNCVTMFLHLKRRDDPDINTRLYQS